MTLRSFFAKNSGAHCSATIRHTPIRRAYVLLASNLAAPASDVAGQFFSALTFSAGKPGFLITVSVLMAIPLLLKVPRQQFLKLGVQFAILLVLSFAAKSGLKHLTEVPRPYTYELEALGIVSSPEDFYQWMKKGKIMR